MNAHNVYSVSSALLSLEWTAMLRSGINGSGRDKIGIARSPAMLTLWCSNVPVCRPERGRCDGVCRSSEGPMTTTRIRNSGATREAYYDSPTSLRVGNKLRSRCKDMVLVRGRNRECSISQTLAIAHKSVHQPWKSVTFTVQPIIFHDPLFLANVSGCFEERFDGDLVTSFANCSLDICFALRRKRNEDNWLS